MSLQLPITGSTDTTVPKFPSQERFVYILSLYPILKSILLASHRFTIISLGRTCHSIRNTLIAIVGRQNNTFPLCTRDLKRCTLCHVPVCRGCRVEAVELVRPAVLMSHEGCLYAIVGGQAPGLDRGTRTAIERAKQRGVRFHSFLFTVQKLEHDYLCQSCFPTQGPTMDKLLPETKPEWIGRGVVNSETPGGYTVDPTRGVAVTDLVWEDVPRAEGVCTCPEFNPGCLASVHLVRVQSGLVENKFAVFAWVPPFFHQGKKDDPGRETAYFVDMPPPQRTGLNGWNIARRHI